jgi:hypothetical protein
MRRRSAENYQAPEDALAIAEEIEDGDGLFN